MAQRAGPAVDVGGQRGGLERRHAPGQEGADHPGQHVTGAGGGQPGCRPWPAGPARRDRPPPWSVPSAGPPSRSRRPARRAAAIRSGPGGAADQAGVLAVVGGEHHRCPGPRGGRRRRRPRAWSPSASTTTGHGRRRPPGAAPRPRCPARPSPGPTTTARHRAAASSAAVGPPVGRQRDAHRLAGRAGRPGRRRARPGGPCPRRPGRRPGRTGPAAPVMPGDPATTGTADRPLVAAGARGREQVGHVGVLDHARCGARRRRGRCRPPRSGRPGGHRPPGRGRAWGPRRSPSRSAAQRRAAGRPGVAGHPRGDVHGQHRDARGDPGAS